MTNRVPCPTYYTTAEYIYTHIYIFCIRVSRFSFRVLLLFSSTAAVICQTTISNLFVSDHRHRCIFRYIDQPFKMRANQPVPAHQIIHQRLTFAALSSATSCRATDSSVFARHRSSCAPALLLTRAPGASVDHRTDGGEGGGYGYRHSVTGLRIRTPTCVLRQHTANSTQEKPLISNQHPQQQGSALCSKGANQTHQHSSTTPPPYSSHSSPQFYCLLSSFY